MNWLKQIIAKDIVQEIIMGGWSKAQLERDALKIWQDGNRFIFSIGDWAKVDGEDIKSSIERVCPNAEIDWDYELGGPGPGKWEQLF